MKVDFFFGPDKTPFGLHETGIVESASTMPFHGIISRGLLIHLREEQIPHEVWHKNAHFLERNDFNIDSEANNLFILKNKSVECKVLTFGQSAYFAKLFVENFCGDFKVKKVDRCEIWNIKEGHTSSVWKVTLLNSDFKENPFILNIARDQEASAELKRASEQMKIITENCPNINMAKVYDIQRMTHDFNGLLLKTVVTRNQWIDNSHEIHLKKGKLGRTEQYILVERFLTKNDSPTSISSVYGRKFSKEETVLIKNSIRIFLNQAKKILNTTPDLNINDGDIVWNGKSAFIVAIT